jgi:hypothetical protein
MAPWRESGLLALGDIGTMLGQERSGVGAYGNDPRYRAIFQDEYNKADAIHRAGQGGRALSVAETIDPTNYNAEMQRIQQTASQRFEQQYPDVAQQTNRSDPNFGLLNKKFTLADFWNDPVTQASYQSGLDLGTQALNRSAGARGSLNSGSQLKALLRFGNDYTGQQAGASQARFVGDQTNIFNRLASISGLGQTTAAQTGQLGQMSAQNIGQILTAQGNARGAAAIAQGNIYGGTANNIGNLYMQQQYLNSLNNKNTNTNTNNGYQYGNYDWGSGE